MDDTVWAGTDDGLVGLGGPAPGLEGAITALSADGRSAWAVTDGTRIFRLTEGAWTTVAEVEDLRVNCLLPLGDRSALLGTSEAHLLRVTVEPEGRSRIERAAGFDRAKGRAYWHTPWGGPPDVRSLDADTGGTLYANVHVGGILRSDDGGETWAPTGIDIDADVHQVRTDPAANDRVLAATAYGLAVSTDAGETWTTEADGLRATYCRAVAPTRRGALVSASEGHHGRNAAVYRFDGLRLERCEDGLPEWFSDNVDTHCLAAVHDLAALGTADGSVFRTRDGGGSWEQIAEGLARIRCLIVRR